MEKAVDSGNKDVFYDLKITGVVISIPLIILFLLFPFQFSFLFNNLLIFAIISFSIQIIHAKYVASKLKLEKVDESIDTSNLRSLRPGLAGTIFDGIADSKEIFATVVDLVIRGYISLKKSGGGVILKKARDASHLLDYEKRIINLLFKRGDEVSISSLTDFPYFTVAMSINEEAVKEGLLSEHFLENFDKKMSGMKKYFVIPWIVSIISFLGVFSFVLFDPSINTFFMSLILVFNLIFTFVNFIVILGLSALPTRTPKGEAYKKKYLEFRNWLMKYPLTKGILSEEYVAYAIALGTQKRIVSQIRIANFKHGTSKEDMKQFLTEYSEIIPESIKNTMKRGMERNRRR